MNRSPRDSSPERQTYPGQHTLSQHRSNQGSLSPGRARNLSQSSSGSRTRRQSIRKGKARAVEEDNRCHDEELAEQQTPRLMEMLATTHRRGRSRVVRKDGEGDRKPLASRQMEYGRSKGPETEQRAETTPPLKTLPSKQPKGTVGWIGVGHSQTKPVPLNPTLIAPQPAPELRMLIADQQSMRNKTRSTIGSEKNPETVRNTVGEDGGREGDNEASASVRSPPRKKGRVEPPGKKITWVGEPEAHLDT